MTRPRAADDFAVIRARMEELRRERAQVSTERDARPLGPPPYHSATSVLENGRQRRLSLAIRRNSSDRDLERELARQARRGGPRKPSQVPDSYYVHRLVK